LRRVAAREPLAPDPFDAQSGSAIQALNPFVMDALSFPLQQNMQSAIAKARLLPGQRDQSFT
jgi:hypothetical protein